MGKHTPIKLFASHLPNKAAFDHMCEDLQQALRQQFPNSKIKNCALICIRSERGRHDELHATFDISPSKAGLAALKHLERINQEYGNGIRVHRYIARNPFRKVANDPAQPNRPPLGIERRRAELKIISLEQQGLFAGRTLSDWRRWIRRANAIRSASAPDFRRSAS